MGFLITAAAYPVQVQVVALQAISRTVGNGGDIVPHGTLIQQLDVSAGPADDAIVMMAIPGKPRRCLIMLASFF